jgi:hypothetical protein
VSTPSPTNPLGAKRVHEYVCVDVQPVPTREGLVQLFIAVDAFSNYVMGFDVRKSTTIRDYVAFLDKVGEQHDLADDVTLIADLPEEYRRALLEEFPFFKDVQCDAAKAASITSDFRTFFLARLAEGPSN